ncbi:MAG: hypothetical protein KatS3mg033_0566 [Thermonema sp.]|uniref:glycosyltransferase family 2 protein n=1 Tax=Thermonema sp. TaxID=2231181 RepID=UPI0021DF4093|nr:glycosyltransferase family A protein [Thermonema sp.]GIV38766.1 MAG: hypothetical protein KatS3mg033_0566 [Thermonema sp.]
MEEISAVHPLVSVVMPVYNAEKFLAEAIESILNQTFTDFEFLIFNDGSTDNSLKIIQQYQRKDSRIKLVYSGENKGYVFHLNEGIRLAKGKYIARMDADDIALPERLEKQVEFLEKNEDYVLCGSRIKCFGKSEHVVDLPIENNEIHLKMLYINPLAHPSVMIRKSVLIDKKLFYYDGVMPAEDYDLWVRLAQFGKFYNFRECLLLYRIHNKNISYQKYKEEQIASLVKTEQRYIEYFFNKLQLNKREITLLHLMFRHRDTLDIQKARDLVELIKKIESQDVSHKYVSNQEIKKLLRKKFFYLCTTSTHLGWKLWYLYIKSGLTITSVSLNFKFLIKALLKYKKN